MKEKEATIELVQEFREKEESIEGAIGKTTEKIHQYNEVR